MLSRLADELSRRLGQKPGTLPDESTLRVTVTTDAVGRT